MSNSKDEVLFVGTAEAEHLEMYLKAIWHIKEKNEPVKISVIAKMLNVRQPSVVQMLKKLNEKELVEYNKAGVFLTETGEKIGSSMMRNSRLLEVLMDSALKVEIDEEMVCGIEHHMNMQFTDALCTMLNHQENALMIITFLWENVVVKLNLINFSYMLRMIYRW